MTTEEKLEKIEEMKRHLEALKFIEDMKEEAKRVGKCRWTCDHYLERYVYEEMNPYWYLGKEPYPQETFKETQYRWFNEGVINKLPVGL